MAADAADYVPTLANLPPGFTEVAVDAFGGDLEPTIALRRAFAASDGSCRLVVDVSLGTSEHDAHRTLNARANQLIRYHGWRVTPTRSFGENGYRGTGAVPDGSNSAMIAFRIRAVVAEIRIDNTAGSGDIALMDNVARLVERRIQADPAAVAYQPGWPVEPVQVPGKEPVVPDVASGLAPGPVVASSQSASGDLLVSVERIERPWVSSNPFLRPAAGMEHVAVDVRLANGASVPTYFNIAQFELATADGARYDFQIRREPALGSGQVLPGESVHGWITFEIPRNSRLAYLLWRPTFDRTVALPL